MKALVVFVAVLSALAACSSNGGGSGGTGPGAGPGGCSAACGAMCSNDFCTDCNATSAKYSDAFESLLFACVQEGADASCGTLWGGCALKAMGATPRRPIDETYQADCTAKRTECDAQGMGFTDDDCMISMVLEPSFVAQAQDCLTKTCADTRTCLIPIFK